MCATSLLQENFHQLSREGEQLIFAHAMRLTREPAATRQEHIQQLRYAELDDHAILQLTMLCSYFSFENRVALALGIPIENELS